MPKQYACLAEVTVGAGGAASIDFTSIPNTYTDLIIFTSLRTNANSGSDQMLLKFNTSTSNFTTRFVYGNASSTFSGTLTNYAIPNNTTDQSINTFNNGYIYIPNYTSSVNKSYSADGTQESNSANVYSLLNAGLWSNTAALTSISLYPSSSGSYVQYSTATLYGITNS